MHLPLIVSVAAHTHADIDFQNGSLTAAALAADSLTGYANLEVCEGSGLE